LPQLPSNTIRANGSAIILFLSFLKATGRKHLEAVTRDDVGAFIEHEQDRGMGPATVSTRLRMLYAFFHCLIERDVIHPDVLKRKMHIKVPDALPRAIDPEDIRQLLAVIKNPRDRAMILTLLRTGMRIGELLNTKLKGLNLKDKCIEIFEAQKNRAGRVVYLSDDACSALKKWLKLKGPQTEYLFNGHGVRPLSYAAAWAVFRKYLNKAGLSHKGYTLHSLSHTCTSELLNAGMHLECLQPLLGHHSIEMTRRAMHALQTIPAENNTIKRWGIRGAITLHEPNDSPNPKNKKIYHGTPFLKAYAANYEDTKLFCFFRVFHLSCFRDCLFKVISKRAWTLKG
jgi:site-specific recombinase XerD